MRRFSDLPIQHKMTGISLLTTTVALALACAGFVGYELVTFKKDLVDDVSSVAGIVGYNSAAALSFNDAGSAKETLQALSAKPHIVAACIYDQAGRVFATFPPGRSAAGFPPPPSSATEHFAPDHLDLFRPIVVFDENVGTIYVRTGLGEMRERLRRYALITGAVLVVAIFVAYVMASRLQRVISVPVSDLVAVANRVAVDRDYAIRAVKRGDDELGRLIDSFNDMLGQIQARDGVLQKTHEELEVRVAGRTRDLARERARFKFIFDSVPVGFTWMEWGQLASRMVNPAHARITGVPVERCQELELYRQATHPEDRARQDAVHARLLAGEISHYDIEKRYVHDDGSIYWTAFSVHLHRGATSDDVQEISTLVDITERKRVESQLEETHQQLMVSSRRAGMAEVAVGVLHNVGNVLNSVNVSAALAADMVRRTEAVNVKKLAGLFDQHKADLARFLTQDPRGRTIPAFLGTLAETLASEQQTLTAELAHLHKNVEHIKDIVAMQQSYAGISGVIEAVSVPDVIEDALRMNAGSPASHAVVVSRDDQATGVVHTDKHKVLQILVNLVVNARHACEESDRTDPRIIVRTTSDDRGVQIAVIDNGVGIAAENLTRIFSHGFTTRKHGHGFGLHNSALAAQEIGGSLNVQSAGPGHGAVFTLELPFNSRAPASGDLRAR